MKKGASLFGAGVLVVLAILAFPAFCRPPLPRVPVGPGTYRPVYPPSPGEAEIGVNRFQLAVHPVTQAQYQAFVAAEPKWAPGAVNSLFADEGYLGDWEGEAGPGGGADPHAPVTRVSWYAARAFCSSHGGRLPTEAEWELAAAASEKRWDARGDPEFVQRLLAWYGEPTPARLPSVGKRRANRWGVQDLHGLVWEWVEDFNASMAGVDSWNDKEKGQDSRFCGSGAAGATDARDYASFMRVAFRSSLEGRSTVRNLGFRCAWDGP